MSASQLPVRRLLGLASPFAAIAVALCSDPATGPEQIRLGTFRLAVTGDAAVDRNLYGATRADSARVDTTRQGRPVVRHDLVLEDRDSGVRIDVAFLALAGATGARRIVAAGDSLPAGDDGEPVAAAVLEAGSLAPAGASVRGGELTITVNSTDELAGRLRLRASPSAPADSVALRTLHLSGNFRAAR